MLKRRIFAASLASVLALSSSSVAAFAADEKNVAYASKSDLSTHVENMKKFDEEESDQYGTIAVENFEKVLEYAENVSNNEDATADERAVAYLMLTEARSKVIQRSPNELKSLLDQCKKAYDSDNILNEDIDGNDTPDYIYEDEEWNTFVGAYDYAEAVSEDEGDPAEITDAWEDLNTAYSELLNNKKETVRKTEFTKAINDFTKVLEKEYDYNSWQRGTVDGTGKDYDDETYAWGTLFYHVSGAYSEIIAAYDKIKSIESLNETSNKEIIDAYKECKLAASILNGFTPDKMSTKYTSESAVLKLVKDTYKKKIASAFGWEDVAGEIQKINTAASGAFSAEAITTPNTPATTETELAALASGEISVSLGVEAAFCSYNYKDQASNEMKGIAYKSGTVTLSGSDDYDKGISEYANLGTLSLSDVKTAIETAVTNKIKAHEKKDEWFSTSESEAEGAVKAVLGGSATDVLITGFKNGDDDKADALAELKTAVINEFMAEYDAYKFDIKNYPVGSKYTAKADDSDPLGLLLKNSDKMKTNIADGTGMGDEVKVFDGTYYKDETIGGDHKLKHGSTASSVNNGMKSGVARSASANVSLDTVLDILFTKSVSYEATEDGGVSKYTSELSSEERESILSTIYDANKGVTFSADGKDPGRTEWAIIGQYLEVSLSDYFDKSSNKVRLAELVALKDDSYDLTDKSDESALFADSHDAVVKARKDAIALINECKKNGIKEVDKGSGSEYKKLKDAMKYLQTDLDAFTISYDDVANLIAAVAKDVENKTISDNIMSSASDLALKLALIGDIKAKSGDNVLADEAIVDGEFKGFNRVYTTDGEVKLQNNTFNTAKSKGGANQSHYDLKTAYKALQDAYESPTTTKGDV